jgi:hypothetical protein
MDSLLWKVLSEEQTDCLYAATDADDLLLLLGEYFQVPFHPDSDLGPALYKKDPTQALCDIILDFYKYAFAFCKEVHFSVRQTSVFLAMAKTILDLDIYGPDPTMEKSFAVFSEILTTHSVSRSPVREGIFSLEDSGKIFEYFSANYFR